MGAMFIGQQFLQNVLGYDTLDGRGRDPARARLHGDRRAAVGEARRGARRPVHAARRLRRSCLLGFVTMLLLWNEGSAYWQVGAGLRASSAPASGSRGPRRRTRSPGSVPVDAGGDGVGHRGSPARPRRRDHAVDLRRAADGGLRGRGGRRRSRASPNADQVSDSVAGQLTKSFASAETPPSSTRSTRRRSPPPPKQSFLEGEDWAYIAGIVAVVLGAALCSSCSRGRTRNDASSPSITPPTRPGPARRRRRRRRRRSGRYSGGAERFDAIPMRGSPEHQEEDHGRGTERRSGRGGRRSDRGSRRGGPAPRGRRREGGDGGRTGSRGRRARC